MTNLQNCIISSILAGKLNAMLQWGLENNFFSANELRAIPAMKIDNAGAPFDRVAAFKDIHSRIRSAGGANLGALFAAFDNTFTTRLGL